MTKKTVDGVDLRVGVVVCHALNVTYEHLFGKKKQSVYHALNLAERGRLSESEMKRYTNIHTHTQIHTHFSLTHTHKHAHMARRVVPDTKPPS